MPLPALGAVAVGIKAAVGKALTKGGLMASAKVVSTSSGFAVKSGLKTVGNFAGKGQAASFAAGYNAFLGGSKMSGLSGSQASGFRTAQKNVNQISQGVSRTAVGAIRDGSRSYSAPKRLSVVRGRGSRVSGSNVPRPRFPKAGGYSKLSNIAGPKFSASPSYRGPKFSSSKYSMAAQKPNFSDYSHRGARYSAIKYSSSSRNFGRRR